MKKHLLLFIVFCLATMTQAQQPYTGCYHPEDLKNWVAGEDPNDIFSKSSIPLQERFVDETIKANPNSTFSNALIAPDLTLAKDCSKGFAQGRNTFDEMYIFNYWQYIDMVIWWGGSAGEGVFICPTGSAIDAAHKNGVKILGNIFFAPGAFGGQSSWVTETLEKDEAGNYIIADKLIEVAEYFGFDGWFLNEETNHFAAQSEWENFCAYFSANSDLELQMYNATSSFGNGQKWMLRNEAGEETGTSYFVDYGGTYGIDTHTSYAESLGADKYDLFYGVNQGTSAYSGNANFAKILPQNNHKASLAPFMERVTWRQGNSDDQYDLGKDDIHSFFRYTNKYWVGAEDPNPSNDRGGMAWSGMANYVPSRTFIQSKPFVTTFNTGYGIRRSVKGDDKGVTGQKWVHQGMQDVLPTWRWWWQDAANKELSCELTLDDSYEGANSIKVEGNLNANDANEIRLYKTKLDIESGDVFKLVFKNSVAGASNIKVGLAFTEDNNAFSYLDAGVASGDWDIKELDLSAYAGKTLSMISIKYESTSALSNFVSYIGELGVLGGDALSCSSVSNISVQKELGIEGGDVRLTWDAATGDVLHYNVYLKQGADKVLVGQTPSTAFYIPELTRTSPAEPGVKVFVTSVTKDFEESTEGSTDVSWGVIPAPVVKIKASSTFAVSGTEITFTAIANNYPTSYDWTMPADAVLVSDNGSEVVYSFPTEGIFDIAVSVANSTGTTDLLIEDLITIDNTNTLSNVALNKSIADHNGHFGSEAPEKLLDGVTNKGGSEKWCFGGQKEHFVIIDLENQYKIFSTKLYDANVNESASNLKNYKVLYSLDNSEGSYVELFNEDGNREADDIKIDHFKGTVARYVKLVPYDFNDGITIRLWELEINGMVGPLSVDTPEPLVKDINKSESITLNFDMSGEAKADNFSVEVYPQSDEDGTFISVTNVTVNASSLSFNVNTLAYGDAKYIVKIVNGGWSATSTGNVAVVDPTLMNFFPYATGKKAFALAASDGSVIKDHSGDIDKVLDGITDGEYINYKYASTAIAQVNTCELSFDKSYSLAKLEMWFREVSYAKKPNSIKLLTSTDGVLWTEAEGMVPEGIVVEWNLSQRVTSSMFKIEMHYENGYDDECEPYEIKGIGGLESATSVDQIKGNLFDLVVYPNPVINTANLKIELPVSGIVKAEIFNLVGVKEGVVFEGSLSKGTHNINIDNGVLSRLNSGVYMVVVSTPSGTRTVKINKL